MKIVVLVFAVAALVGLYALKSTYKPSTSSPSGQAVVQATSIPKPTPTPFIRSLNSKGDKLTVSLTLNAKGIKLAALAARIKYNYTGDEPDIKIADSDTLKTGVQTKSNKSLLDAGWLFPINKVEIDKVNKQVNIDFAAANVTPEGYIPEGPVDMATFEITALTAIPNLSLSLDSALTKVVSKRGEEISLTTFPEILILK
ncbi:MAG: hypothetical protein UX91_C0005G0052 [Candidatus Amesbacteria bacterium GW2011_GWB1_47_19]|nr:MAG: hypothetical protein UW51_C0007G0052 [Candidatus Amesbacteria bacterium GW2011_GWA1_44_24]KKU31134.1 MAG: hypothetical protein UX46_C0007G0052 [Candidatus Amesbacteria bacterium GW2011_GWC1_46_24]KKU67255.1 MAG: hypothetical protein UX91_C0005G0052 [Candidatus Amesbacteria bacterium GW2011_GWB1_47_19]OGD05812.1 MAG: hypothetical protein A2379_01715 [Candidatus Amesbacteria bacterium RIFOXYB1_FULL_47_13]HBC72675.1 hypothetical protein [Candidatus Amesbacteria bacterium]